MDQQLTVKPYEPGDEASVVAIAVAAWAPVYAYRRERMGDDLFHVAHPDWREEKARQVRAACRDGGADNVCVAAVGGRVVGFCTFYVRRTPGVGEIGNNAVDPEWQGRGIAQRLYAYAFDALRAQGVAAVRVHTGGDPAHAPARRAYEKAGFQVALPEVTYYRAL
jgi:ribosomal protein S18 acetylase RimI-like enzyme